MGKMTISSTIRMNGFGVYNKEETLICYITSWSKTDLSGKDSILIYNEDISGLVCVKRGSTPDKLVVTKYDHVDEKLLEESALNKCLPAILRDFLPHEEEFGKIPMLFNLITQKKVLFSDFLGSCRFDKLGKFTAFIYGRNEVEKGFPRVYILSCEIKNNEGKSIFNVQLSSSLCVAPSANAPTETGKLFTFLLLNSIDAGKFNEYFPTLYSVGFPTSTYMGSIPTNFNTTALKEIAKKIGAVSLVENDIIELPENSDSTLILRERLASDISNRGSVKLSEMLDYGVENTVKLIKNTKNMVRVELDIAGLLKEAFILGGNIYGVMLNSTDSWEESTGDSSGLFIPCLNGGFSNFREPIQ